MAKAEGFTDPDAAVIKEGEEEPIPQVGARVQDRLDLADGEDTGQLHRRLQRDRPCRRRQRLGEVMEERLPSTPVPGSPPRREQLSDVDAVSYLVLVERGERRELPVDRRCAEMWLDRGQHSHGAVATRRWQPQPGDELADVL